MNPDNIAFNGELQMLGWSESDKGGRVVKFQCAGDDVDHPFKHFPSKARFMCVFVQIGDDEKPVEQERAASTAAAGALMSNQCALLCKDKDFWCWIEAQVWGVAVASEKKATEVVKDLLGIESRSELDSNLELGQRFISEMLHPFNEWKSTALRVGKR